MPLHYARRSHSHTDKPENNVYIRETGFLKDQYDKNAHYTLKYELNELS